MFMDAKRATPDELEPLIRQQRAAYELTCKICRDLGRISAPRHGFGSKKYLRKAAETFAEQGWRMESLPICPRCYKKQAPVP